MSILAFVSLDPSPKAIKQYDKTYAKLLAKEHFFKTKTPRKIL